MRKRFFIFGHLGVKSTGSERSSKVKKFLNGEESQRKTAWTYFGWGIEDARSCRRTAKMMAPGRLYATHAASGMCSAWSESLRAAKVFTKKLIYTDERRCKILNSILSIAPRSLPIGTDINAIDEDLQNSARNFLTFCISVWC